VKVEPHSVHCRHDTPDEKWLQLASRNRWAVLMRDQEIGRHRLEFEALINGGVKAFALSCGNLSDDVNAQIIIRALPRILGLIRKYNCPFIAKVYRDSRVEMWKTKADLEKLR
jgi:PIN like domain